MNEITGVPPLGSGCQPTASAAAASSRSGIPNALERAWDWAVSPCVNRFGHVSSWDIHIRAEPDARGVAVIASVYSGEAVARAILAACQATTEHPLALMTRLDEELGLHGTPRRSRQGTAPMISALLELADRVEAATAEQQHEMLLAAYEAVFGHSAVIEYRQPDGERGTRFLRLADYAAFLDAAMTLLPDDHEGMSFVWFKTGCWSLCLYNSDVMASGATRALALTAACLRAHASMSGESKGAEG